jgi:hypothetical protein
MILSMRIFLLVSCTLMYPAIWPKTYTKMNPIPPRLEWNANNGYCGEVSLISAGLYYGQYISQYTARAVATNNKPQNKGQLLLGVNDYSAATKMHLRAVEWNTAVERSTNQFLAWVKKNVIKGYPVAIGVYTNEYLFYHKTNPKAGDPDYDHIVPVTGIGSHHPLTDTRYYRDDVIYFSDNGLWGNPNNPTYKFHYAFGPFQKSRAQANNPKGSIYSLSNDGRNYGIAILGVIDVQGDTLPVRVATNVNYEKPAIKNGSTIRPKPMPLVLTVTVSNLKPGIDYILYRYNKLEAVPKSKFNAQAANACQKWHIKISSGSTYSIKQSIESDDIAVYRAVKASAP